MEEKPVSFGHGKIRLEGLLAGSGGETAAVIAHPHPLMGGDMANGIVEIIVETLFGCGFSTLRFNFRGVGKSTGSFDAGRGERQDLLAAIALLEERGFGKILTAGYSFGAWVNAGILGERPRLPALLVSPPIALFGFDIERLRGNTGLIVCGDRDPYCPAERIREIAAAVGCRLDLLPGADHFFAGRETALAGSIHAFAARLPAANPAPMPQGTEGGRAG